MASVAGSATSANQAEGLCAVRIVSQKVAELVIDVNLPPFSSGNVSKIINKSMIGQQRLMSKKGRDRHINIYIEMNICTPRFAIIRYPVWQTITGTYCQQYIIAMYT